MKQHVKILAAAAIASVLTLGAVGCVPMKQNGDLDEEMAEIIEKIDFNAGSKYTGSLKVAVMRQQSEIDNANAFVDSFKARYPNITVEVEPIANYQEDLMLTHAYAYTQQNFKDMPDVFWMSNEDVASYEAKGMLMPISYLDREDTKFSTDELVQTMVSDATYDGQLYFMPRDYNQIVMYYNQELFDKAEVPSPATYKDTDGKVRAMTQEEFSQMLVDVADWMYSDASGKGPDGKKNLKDGRVAEIQAFWNSLNYAVFKGNGATIVGEDGHVNLQTDEALDTLYYFWELAYREYAAQMTDVGMSAHNLFIQGLSALCFETRASLSDIVKSSPASVRTNLGVAPAPNLSTGEYYVGAGCSGYGMYRYTDDPTAAWLFLKHVVSEQGQNAFCQTGNGCPVLKSMFDDEGATWKNIRTENAALYGQLPANFDHDAFVYKYDTAGVTIEYVDKVPTAAQEEVLFEMRVAVSNVVQSLQPPAENRDSYTKEMMIVLMKQLLNQQGSEEKMNNAIDKAIAEQEKEEAGETTPPETDETQEQA